MPLLIVLFGILLLLVLILGLRLNAFLALVLAALVIGVMEGMPFGAAVKSIEKGVGDTLGSLTLIIGFGAMLGSLIVESGAAQTITFRLLNLFGEKRLPWAMVLTGFIIGVPLFYNAAFVLLVPVAFAIIKATGLPSLYVGIPMAAALSVTHGYLPPHPGPSAIAVIYKADFGLTLLYGIIVAIPAIIIAGPIWGGFLKNYKVPPPKDLFGFKERTEAEMPGFGVSLFVALVPVLLMAISAVVNLMLAEGAPARAFFELVGNPVVALLISVLIAIWLLGVRRGRNMNEVNQTLVGAVTSTAIVLFTIGGGGALKGVIVDSGVGKYIVGLVSGYAVSPLFMAWGVAALIRVSLGSATVAALTAGGIVLPLIDPAVVSPELMVLATGAGSLMFSHVNDPGFWMFKEYFNLSIPQTIASWSVMETIVSILGLMGVLALDVVV